MAKKSSKSEKYQRWSVIVVGALFLLSMASFALDSGNMRSNSVELPNSVIIDGNLTDMQRALIVSNYGTVVDYGYSSDCGMECFETKTALEILANKYYGYIFVVYSGGISGDGITVSNYKGSVDVDNVTAVEDELCNVIYNHPTCSERRAMAAVFTRNETELESDEDDVFGAEIVDDDSTEDSE